MEPDRISKRISDNITFWRLFQHLCAGLLRCLFSQRTCGQPADPDHLYLPWRDVRFHTCLQLIQAENYQFINVFANSQYIFQVMSGGAGLDNLGNPYNQWSTFSGTYTANTASTIIEVSFMCQHGDTMTFGLDSFYWTAQDYTVR